MINYLNGILIHKSPTNLIIDVHGVGFEVNITLSCFESLGDVGTQEKVMTYLYVREDVLQLYGFKSKEEYDLFLNLISAPGIGPKKAQLILSSVNAILFKKYILEEDSSALTSISGIGKKTAQRLIVDLKDKIETGSSELVDFGGEESASVVYLKQEAIAALGSLGFNKNSAQVAVEKVMQKSGRNISLEELIKQALQYL